MNAKRSWCHLLIAHICQQSASLYGTALNPLPIVIKIEAELIQSRVTLHANHMQSIVYLPFYFSNVSCH